MVFTVFPVDLEVELDFRSVLLRHAQVFIGLNGIKDCSQQAKLEAGTPLLVELL